MRLFSHKHRPVHFGSYPLERLPRLASPTTQPPGLNGHVPDRLGERSTEGPVGMGHAFDKYIELFDGLRSGAVAPVQAPIPDDPDEIAANVKASIYFLDADMAGICETPPDAWHGVPRHRFTVIVLV